MAEAILMLHGYCLNSFFIFSIVFLFTHPLEWCSLRYLLISIILSACNKLEAMAVPILVAVAVRISALGNKVFTARQAGRNTIQSPKEQWFINKIRDIF